MEPARQVFHSTTAVGQLVKDVLMRIQPWMKAVAGLFMLAVVHKETSGQSPVPPAPAPPGAVMTAGPAAPMYAPPMSGNGYATPVPGNGYSYNAPNYPGAMPPTYQPWPEISPFHPANVAQTTHTQENGLWFKEVLHRKRTYYSSVELMSVSFRGTGNRTIGSPYAAPPDFIGPNQEAWPLGELIDPRTVFESFPTSENVAPMPTGRFIVDPRIISFPALDTVIFNSNSNVFQYRVLDTSDMSGMGSELGTQIRWGFEDQDGSGVMTNAWWAFEDDSNFQSGSRHINGVPVNQALTAALDGQNLFIHAIVPLNNGEQIFPFFGPGTPAKYDVLVEMKHKTEAGGANVSFYTPPTHSGQGWKLRPLWGIRYMYLNEEFSFLGIDSGFNYTLDPATRRPALNTAVPLYQQYEATLGSDVESHIAGPEIGFRIDLGNDGEGFKMWTETIFGLNANYEQINLAGDNIGDPLFDARFVNLLNPRMLDPANESRFSDEKSTTHVSPLFQQTIQARFQAFRDLPLIRNVALFDNSAFRFGYTFTWIGAVNRPAEVIDWKGFPLYPSIKSNRDDWWMHQLNFGIDWVY